MKIVHTERQSPDDIENQWIRDQVYNGLDCCVTAEVLDAILSQLDPDTSPTYGFSRALQAPILEMRLRGVLIDQARKAEVIDLYLDQIDRLEHNLDRIVYEGVGLSDFNWRSTRDLQTLFYDRLGIPVIRRKGRP